jgi:hypothetical protein
LETPDDFKVLEVKSVMTKAVAEETLGSVNQKLRWSKAPEMARFREKPCHLVLGAEYIPLGKIFSKCFGTGLRCTVFAEGLGCWSSEGVSRL